MHTERHLLGSPIENLLYLTLGLCITNLVTIRSQIPGPLPLDSGGNRPLTMGRAVLIPEMMTNIFLSSPGRQNFPAREQTMVSPSFSPRKAEFFLTEGSGTQMHQSNQTVLRFILVI